MSLSCEKSGCTVGATGKCFFNVEPASSCPVLRGELPADTDHLDAPPEAQQPASLPESPGSGPSADESDPATAVGEAISTASLPSPARTKAPLSPGRELGLDGLSALARQRPVRLIGLLGAPNAGKTMALVSTYLLAARGKLEGYTYRNSESVFAFDELSKGLRQWAADGSMLEQLVPHTELADERRPGFLHLRLQSEVLGAVVDLAFPDLPGEWTDTLINKDVYDRLRFLQNADAIWLFVDGKKLADVNFGHAISARMMSLIGRLALNLPNRPPLKLVVTRADQYEDLPSAMIEPILDEARDKGFELTLHEVISVDRSKRSRNGQGIRQLLDEALRIPELTSAVERVPENPSRQILRYRRDPAP